MPPRKTKKTDLPDQVYVIMECTVTKEIICEGCTAQEAEADPWKYAVDERELDTIDAKVLRSEEYRE